MMSSSSIFGTIESLAQSRSQVTVIPRAVLDWGASPYLRAEWDQLVGMDILAKPNPTYYI